MHIAASVAPPHAVRAARQLAGGTDTDAESRITELERRRAQIDAGSPGR